MSAAALLDIPSFGPRPKTAFLTRDECPFVDRIFDHASWKRIAKVSDLHPVILTPRNFEQHKATAREVEVLFTCWGMPKDLALNPELFPALRALFFSGGSTKYFARTLLERDVLVTGARSANAISVAHFCLGQIILSCKGYFRNTRQARNFETAWHHTAFAGAGVYHETVALIGMGAVARELAALLHPLRLNILVVDPYLEDYEAEALGVRRVSMEQAFAQAYVVSNHLPDLAHLTKAINYRLLSSMRRDATFINTGRGAQVDEAALIEVFGQRPDLTALLDVTMSEPPESGSALYSLPNVQMSTHIAGALNNDVRRLGEFITEEFERFVRGEPLLHSDTLDVLERLA